MSAQHRKYPRTPHLPWSPGVLDGDVRLDGCATFEGRRVVVTEKLDGENTSLYHDGLHARSLDSRHHPSRNWVKAWHGSISGDIPPGWRLCGENVYARHSIPYAQLAGYFYLFSVWDDANRCLSWDETLEWADLLGCPTPREFYRGAWDRKRIEAIEIDRGTCEGYVVRLVDGFGFDDFGRSVGKWVRVNHVQTDEHWMHAPVVPNQLRARDG